MSNPSTFAPSQIGMVIKESPQAGKKNARLRFNPCGFLLVDTEIALSVHTNIKGSIFFRLSWVHFYYYYYQGFNLDEAVQGEIHKTR